MDMIAALFIGKMKLRALLVLAAGMATACAFAEELKAESPWQRLVNGLARAYRHSAID